MDEAASQQLLPSSEELMTAQSSGQGSEASGDALDQLMESACCSLPEQLVGQSPSAVPVFGTSFTLVGCDNGQGGGSEDRQGPQKKRCGRPRVYDLDTPVATGKALDAVASHIHLYYVPCWYVIFVSVFCHPVGLLLGSEAPVIGLSGIDYSFLASVRRISITWLSAGTKAM